ncbi:dynein axonemal heavy chain 7-like [Schistocerca cancellata]|uniref:dynein axonemal heavy chain 7-like n=1 Tax=Schistocerca cancellata TaxID=274614 RepID=UPI002118E1F4|nr:dynein axonemal heavy chain 7-like [Schistocerca cancellata]
MQIVYTQICKTFEEIVERALKPPETTEELIALGQHMDYVSNTLIEELEERIHAQMQKLGILLETTLLTNDHLELNARTILWLQDIQPIFKENSLMYDKYKTEFEENLQQKTELVNKQLEDLAPKLSIMNHMEEFTNASSYIPDLRKLLRQLKKFDNQIAWINNEETLFKFPHSSYPELDELKNIVQPFAQLVFLIHKWRLKYEVWMNGSFSDLKYDEIESATNDFHKEITDMQKEYRAKLKQQAEENDPRRFHGNVDDPEFVNLPAPMKLCIKTIKQINEFKENFIFIKVLCNPALTKRHWKEMSNILGTNICPDTGTTLRKMIGYNLMPYMDKFEIISTGATKELTLKKALEKMVTEWANVTFSLETSQPHNLEIISNFCDVQALIDDHIVRTLTMRGSAFAKTYESEMINWYENLKSLNVLIENWRIIQEAWLYYYGIFSSDDITAQIPEENKLFKEIDGSYNTLLDLIKCSPLVIRMTDNEQMVKLVERVCPTIEILCKGIDTYLERVRLYFPRFFFLTNHEMLQIISEGSNPLSVQKYLNKCFAGINALKVDGNGNINCLISEHGEEIKLLNHIPTSRNGVTAEKWFSEMETQMVLSLEHNIHQSNIDYSPQRRSSWVCTWPGQVILCVSQIIWTADIHYSISHDSSSYLKGYCSQLQNNINDNVCFVRDKTPRTFRINLEALIVLDVHAKYIAEELLQKRVRTEDDFLWLAQLRFYLKEKVEIHCINAVIQYMYEYLGNTSRLVITPLTDRCFRTIINAYYMHLNASTEGPAGTGKTETTKDLAKTLAVHCIVFNCSEGLNYKTLGKFFMGLAASGAWVCFDEFHRISMNVLSVVAQKIMCITKALQSQSSKFNFEGTQLHLSPSCYICITMHSGQVNRQELPDNLKILFRTIAMTLPDRVLVTEICLYSHGFLAARMLSEKIVTTYRLCSELLSSQNHYDYGMRAIKSVLRAAGKLKLQLPNENEELLLMQTIIKLNAPKLVPHDRTLFSDILSDVFQQNNQLRIVPDIREIVHKEILKLKYQPESQFVNKIIQFLEIFPIYNGIILVGNAFCGKTSALKVVANAFPKLQSGGDIVEEIDYEVINPKSMTIPQIFGDAGFLKLPGVFPAIFKRLCASDASKRRWIVFDGPIDSRWVENLNTVLDDNKKLCLTSGEALELTENMSIIFEVVDLSETSPSTISRCGIIYFEEAVVTWNMLISSWLLNDDKVWMAGNQTLLADIIQWLFPPCLNFVQNNCKQLILEDPRTLVKSTLSLIEMLLNEAVSLNEDHEYLKSWFQAAFMYAVVWGIGGTLDTQSREKFDEFYKNIWKGMSHENQVPRSLDKVDVAVPSKGLIYDHMYTFKEKGTWVYWPELLRGMEAEEMTNVHPILVPTVDSVRSQYVMELHMRNGVPMLLVGHSGTGKSLYYQNLLNRLSQDKYTPASVIFTSQITANDVQEQILSKLNKGKNGLYGPQKGKLCVTLIDNLNMPLKAQHGAPTPIELLRQYFDQGHWYDLRTGGKIFLQNILFFAAMRLPAGIHQCVTKRLLHHLNVYFMNNFSDETVTKIFSSTLMTNLKKNGFAADVMSTVQNIVQATLSVYTSVMKTLRPTPANSHYIFNLRDFSRVIQGCSLIRKESADNKQFFTRLWVHEVLRVYYDRLVDQKDRTWLFEKIVSCVGENFNERFKETFDNLKDNSGQVTEECLRNLIFVNCVDGEKKYEEVLNFDKFLNVAVTALDQYNKDQTNKLNIVLFKFALEHLSRICRILITPFSHGLLIGVGGSGRQSLTRLAAALSGSLIFQPDITETYDLHQWRDDLRNLLKNCGGRSLETAFLITEAQIKEEVFLGDIELLLDSGEVPNIFSVNEKQEILELVRLSAQGGNSNLDISALSVFSFFVNQCRQKLHLILCISPASSSFRKWLHLYPSVINCCTVNWFQVWPEDALDKVAHHYIQDVKISDDIKSSLVVASKYFHVTTRELTTQFYESTGQKIYITSTAYVELVTLFKDLINIKQYEILKVKQRYMIGLEKLLFAAEQVCALQQELSTLRPKLVSAANETAQMMLVIERETSQVEKASAQVREDEKIANTQAAAAQELKNECEADLAQAIPILEDAIAALNTLKPTDITLVKSMKNPPDTVKLVMAAVCVMKDIKPDRINDAATGRKIIDFWGPSKKLLGDMYFLQSLKDFDKDNIPLPIMKKIRTEYLPNKDFKPHIVAKASSAAEGLCKWVMAMDMYDAVKKEVAPKKAKLQVAEREYNATVALLEEKRAQVRKLEEQLAELNAKLNEANQRKKVLENEVAASTNKLMRAEKLIGGLGGEKARWSAAAEALQRDYNSLAGDLLMACGLIAYLSPFTASFRSKCIKDWHCFIRTLKVPCSDDFSIMNVLSSEVKVQTWNICGLPRDDFSTENGVIVDTTKRWSLMVDPQGQANSWIKCMETKNGLVKVKFSDRQYTQILENCVRFGKPVLLENVSEELETPLEPILRKQMIRKGDLLYISFGRKMIEYNTGFRFYMTTSLRTPHFSPEIYSKVTIINFVLTVEGLEDQLLAIVVKSERPELEETRQNLIVESTSHRESLKQVEDDILIALSQSSGNILEDERAIKILDSSKVLSEEITVKQIAAKETQKRIDNFRQSYQPVAHHAALLYYCICDLPNIEYMYQFSLEWFINLYISSHGKNKTRQWQKHLKYIRESFTYNLYTKVCRSLFAKDKLLFSFLICTTIMMSNNQLYPEELALLLSSGGCENEMLNPCEEWLPQELWQKICFISQAPYFAGFSESVETSQEEWKIYINHLQPQTEKLPAPWETRLSHFQKLIVLKIFHPSQVIDAVALFIENLMGRKYVTPPTFDLEKSFEDSDITSPLLFILSPGTDPTEELDKFAKGKDYTSKLHVVSLGEGQEDVVKNLLTFAQEGGEWVCLQNCHLAAPWMNTLENIWENISSENTKHSFRLWLTSYSTKKFSQAILQKSIKIVNETPAALKEKLLHSFISGIIKEPEFFNGCKGKDKEFRRLLYSLCFFHAVIQERQKYGAIGWNRPYNFNESDLNISIRQLQVHINQSVDVPYEAIRYLVGECNYGGHILDEWDQRTLNTILLDFINSSVVYSQHYTFSSTNKKYRLPIDTTYKFLHLLNLLQALPTQSTTEILGLHSNAGIICGINESRHFIQSLRSAYGNLLSAKYKDLHMVDHMLMHILQKIPDKFDEKYIYDKYPALYQETMNSVLNQEVGRFNTLLNTIKTSLHTLLDCVNGLSSLTSTFEDVILSLVENRVPSLWIKASYPSVKLLGSYISDLQKRVNFFKDWCEKGIPSSFWLPGFFFTQAFLSAIKLNYVRKHGIHICMLDFDFEVLSVYSVNEAPDDGVYTYGLFLDGARWDCIRNQLADQYPKQIQEEMPIIWIKIAEISKLTWRNFYVCPLYRTPERRGIIMTNGLSTNFVLAMLLPTELPQSHWIKRGVALLCQTNK